MEQVSRAVVSINSEWFKIKINDRKEQKKEAFFEKVKAEENGILPKWFFQSMLTLFFCFLGSK